MAKHGTREAFQHPNNRDLLLYYRLLRTLGVEGFSKQHIIHYSAVLYGRTWIRESSACEGLMQTDADDE